MYLINSNIQEINRKVRTHNISEDISKKTIEVSAVTQSELDELQNINESTSNLKIMLRNVERLRFSTSISC